MKVHGIVCSYLGDGELDIGKTAAWLNAFVDTLFFYSLQYGTAGRKYSIDYAQTFPDALHANHPMTPTGFFGNPALFRQAAFEAARAAWNYAADDWVVFIDASESLSIAKPYDALELLPDTLLLDDLYNAVNVASGDVLSLRFYTFLNQGPVTERTMIADLALAQSIDAEQAALQAELVTNPPPTRVVEINARLAELAEMEAFNNSVIYWTCAPRYLEVAPSTKRSSRLLRVSGAPSFNWADMDSFASSAPQATGIAVVSYAYARYVEGEPNTANWTQDADIGFANRLLMQQIPSCNLGLPQTYATADPAGALALSPSDVSCPAYCYYYDQFDLGTGNNNFQQWTALWRVNPRDGVWYVNYTLGPVPVDPLTGDPSVPPEQWVDQQPATTGPPGTGQ